MKLTAPSPDSVRTGASAVVKWLFGGGLLVGLALAIAQCSIERENARTATIQTYNMGRVAAFRDSGAELDKKVAAFNDAAAEGRSLNEPRQAVRSALADHAAKTFAMQDAFGDTATMAYSNDLKELQTAIEGTSDATNSGAIITALSRVVVERNKLAEDVTQKATG